MSIQHERPMSELGALAGEQASKKRPMSEDAPIMGFEPGPGRAAFVVAQLGQSLDGRIATLTGDSRYINRTPALDHLHRLRAAVDCVLVGVGTVIADDPQLNVRRVPGRNPARVVIDPRGRLPANARCFALDDGAPAHVIRSVDAALPAQVEDIRLGEPGQPIAPSAIVAALVQRGYRRILVEGGAATISAFIDADMVDRLHLLVSTVIIGSGTPGLQLKPINLLAEARRPLTRVIPLGQGDVLFDCDLRRQETGD